MSNKAQVEANTIREIMSLGLPERETSLMIDILKMGCAVGVSADRQTIMWKNIDKDGQKYDWSMKVNSNIATCVAK